MRAADLSPDRRKRLVPVPGPLHPNVKALVPPPAPREIDAREVLGPLLAAEGAVATVAAVARRLSQPDLITRSLERREAVLSSQIEGTHTDLTQLLEYEATGSGEDLPPDAPVTLGYVRALDHGLRVVRRDGTKGLTLDLIRDLHRVLMDGTIYPYFEGSGAWRLVQNWIGGGGRIEDAILVPAPTDHLEECLTDLERFLRPDLDSPALLALPLRMAIAHAQFEAIHPFSDGNGRVGRLLPPLMLAAEGLTPLYLAGYLKSNQRMYLRPLGRSAAPGGVDTVAAIFPCRNQSCRLERDRNRRRAFGRALRLARPDGARPVQRRRQKASGRFPWRSGPDRGLGKQSPRSVDSGRQSRYRRAGTTRNPE